MPISLRWWHIVETSRPAQLPFLGFYREAAAEVIDRAQRTLESVPFWPPGLRNGSSSRG